MGWAGLPLLTMIGLRALLHYAMLYYRYANIYAKYMLLTGLFSPHLIPPFGYIEATHEANHE